MNLTSVRALVADWIETRELMGLSPQPRSPADQLQWPEHVCLHLVLTGARDSSNEEDRKLWREWAEEATQAKNVRAELLANQCRSRDKRLRAAERAAKTRKARKEREDQIKRESVPVGTPLSEQEAINALNGEDPVEVTDEE